jgi:type II secretory pathway component PulF
VIILLVQVVPEIKTVFEAQGSALPLPSRILVGLSDFVVGHYIMIAGVCVAVLGTFFVWKATPAGGRAWDWFVLRIPIFGYFVRMRAIVEFCSTLGMLVEAGVNLTEALQIVSRIIDNRIIVDTLLRARDKIIKQGKITIYLKETGLFPPVAIYLIKTGEESGQLAQMLLAVANNYDIELRYAADGLATRLNPFMIIVMGVIVGFVVLAIGKPIMSMGDAIKKNTTMGRKI